MTHSTTKGPRVLLQLSRIKHKWSTINLPFILELNYYQHIDKQMVHDTGHIQKCLKSLKSWKSFHLRKTFSWFCSKLLTEAEIEGGFLLVGDQWSLKKNQTQKLNRGLRWFTTRKLLPSTFPNNFWATFRKRDLDFFCFQKCK